MEARRFCLVGARICHAKHRLVRYRVSHLRSTGVLQSSELALSQLRVIPRDVFPCPLDSPR